MNSLEYIDDYFTGRLTQDQKIDFETRIRTDPAFSEELAFYINAIGLLKEEADIEKKIRFKKLYLENKPLHTGRSPIRIFLPYAAAACLLLAIAGLWWIFSPSRTPGRLADRYIAKELTTLPVTMSSIQDSLQKAISLYNHGQLTASGEKFREILLTTPGSAQARIYTGIVYLRLQNYDSALGYFQQLEKDTTLDSNPALFYESLTLMKRNRPGDTGQARLLLQKVVDSSLDKKVDAVLLLKKW